ncbi:MAG TPA: response regulator [Kofleriaceae bacterium]
MPNSSSEEQPIQLARHMALAVVAPVILLIVLGGMLAWQIGRMADSARLVSRANEVLAEFGELQMRLSDKESALRGYLLSGDASLRDQYAAVAPDVALAEVIYKTQDNEVQQSRLRELKGTLDLWLKEAESAVVNAAAKDDVGSLRRRTALIARVRSLIGEGVQMETDLLVRREHENADTERTAKLWFLGLLGLAAVTIAFVSRRQLGVVSKAFGTLVSTERNAKILATEQEWVQRGEATIAAGIVGETSLEEVGKHALDSLVDHTGAQLGSLYVVRGTELVRIAGVAIPDDLPVVCEMDKGQLGRVIQTGKPTRMTDAEAQVVMDGGVAKKTTVELILAPLKIGERITGVVSLGFGETPNERTLELLSNVAMPIATALRGADQRARMQELLEKTQRQGEELQTQHEELRVTNEELEQQGNALREAHLRQQNVQHELEAANANLEEQTAALEVHREELMRTQTDLEQHAQELTRASQYKSEFLARMSHELRTPLNSTLILARLLGDNVGGNLNEDQVRYANTIYSAGNDLLVLINDILDLSKIEAGRLELRLGQVPLARVRDTLLREFEPLALSRGLTFSVFLDPGLPELLNTDEQRLIQVLRNLVSNACKFTERGDVRVTVRPVGDTVEWSVTDTGIGIPADQHDAIFEAFHQIDGSVSRRHGGTGLGLAISRDLVGLLGGSLRIDSTPTKGSTFTFDVPLTPPVVKARMATPDAPVVRPQPTKRVKRLSAADHPTNVVSTPTTSGFDDREKLSPDKRTLLVIEDDVAFAAILRDLARELGYQVLVSHHADEGVELAMRHRPDGILCDVKLPDHSGLSVLERLKRQPSIRHVPIHMLSVEDFSRRSLELGAVGYLLKPASRDELIGAIRRIEDRTSHHVRRVLVVEDDAVQAEALRALLGGTAAEITATPTVKEALALLASTTFDCVVMDLRLQDGTGFELLEKMTADDRITFPPVIIYTGKALTDQEEDKLRAYSSSIIVKGARSPERLLDEVTLFLHSVEADLPADRQQQLHEVRNREAVFEGKTVLIVEDDVRNVFALSSVLEPRGLKTIIARNGREALDMLAKHDQIDLVLMDVMMPEMNGIDATKAIRTQDQYEDLPIIALTAKAMADDRQACLDAGASDYLSKPIDVDMLLSLLRVWMPR